MNLASLIEFHARVRGAKSAIESGGKSISYRELDLSARRYAQGLRRRGVAPGDLVGLLMRDSVEHIIAALATMRVGAVILPMDWRWKPAEIERTIERFRPLVLVSDLPPERVDRNTMLHVLDLEHFEPDVLPCAELHDAPLVYALSSGTTGEPKAMVLTHENMHARFVHCCSEFPLLRDDVFLMALPLAYGAARTFSLSVLCLGATMVQISPIFEPSELVRIVNDRAVTATFLPPNVTRALLALGRDGENRLMPNLRLYISGTAGLRPDERAMLRERVARHTVNFYASAASGPATIHRDADDSLVPASVGLPVLGIDLEVVERDGSRVEHGATGWVRMRGPSIAQRFAGDDPASDEGVRDGWYYPGDLGMIDENGYLHLRGRTADLINHGGVTIAAAEIEQVLMSHPAVREAAVVGVASPELGEEVVAYVVLSAAADPRELVLHCRRHLAPFKVPKRAIVLDQFPRNPNGKVIKAELRQSIFASAPQPKSAS